MLDFLSSSQFWGEVARLAAQLSGALLIAWLTVRWALGRYKSEKMWEREIAAFFSVLEAIAELRQVNEEWYRDFAHNVDNPDREKQQMARWNFGRQKLDALAGSASLILPTSAQEVLSTLGSALRKKHEDYMSDLVETEVALNAARTSLIGIGRQRFGLKHVRS